MSDPLVPAGQETRILSVSELTALIKEALETGFADVYVVGELSRVSRAASGHMYLTLKDERAVMRAVIWKNVAASLRFEPKEGLEVIARGSIDVYPPRGSYQLIVSWMEPRGLGALQLAFRQLTEKLRNEGLFRPELKKPLPPFPRRVGIVTSPTGAAIRDIINVIKRRFAAVELYLLPVRVQGREAAPEIAAAIELLNARMPELDVIIVGRGGGSLEDLWPFNEEIVARAIYHSAIPIVSAVGHEIDFSISDFAADVRAATPTEAAEIVVPNGTELLRRIEQLRRRLASALAGTVERARQRLTSSASRRAFRHPETLLRERAQRLDEALERLKSAVAHRLRLTRERAQALAGRLDALNPLRVLERGYSVTLGPDGSVLRSVARLSRGDRIVTRLHRGQIHSDVVQLQAPSEQGADDGQSP